MLATPGASASTSRLSTLKLFSKHNGETNNRSNTSDHLLRPPTPPAKDSSSSSLLYAPSMYASSMLNRSSPSLAFSPTHSTHPTLSGSSTNSKQSFFAKLGSLGRKSKKGNQYAPGIGVGYSIPSPGVPGPSPRSTSGETSNTDPTTASSSVAPRSPRDEGIGTPWNFQHHVHVDEHFTGLPPSWASALAERGYSQDEIVEMQHLRAQGRMRPLYEFPGGASTYNIRSQTSRPNIRVEEEDEPPLLILVPKPRSDSLPLPALPPNSQHPSPPPITNGHTSTSTMASLSTIMPPITQFNTPESPTSQSASSKSNSFSTSLSGSRNTNTNLTSQSQINPGSQSRARNLTPLRVVNPPEIHEETEHNVAMMSSPPPAYRLSSEGVNNLLTASASVSNTPNTTRDGNTWPRDIKERIPSPASTSSPSAAQTRSDQATTQSNDLAVPQTSSPPPSRPTPSLLTSPEALQSSTTHVSEPAPPTPAKDRIYNLSSGASSTSLAVPGVPQRIERRATPPPPFAEAVASRSANIDLGSPPERRVESPKPLNVAPVVNASVSLPPPPTRQPPPPPDQELPSQLPNETQQRPNNVQQRTELEATGEEEWPASHPYAALHPSQQISRAESNSSFISRERSEEDSDGIQDYAQTHNRSASHPYAAGYDEHLHATFGPSPGPSVVPSPLLGHGAAGVELGPDLSFDEEEEDGQRERIPDSPPRLRLPSLNLSSSGPGGSLLGLGQSLGLDFGIGFGESLGMANMKLTSPKAEEPRDVVQLPPAASKKPAQVVEVASTTIDVDLLKREKEERKAKSRVKELGLSVNPPPAPFQTHSKSSSKSSSYHYDGRPAQPPPLPLPPSIDVTIKEKESKTRASGTSTSTGTTNSVDPSPLWREVMKMVNPDPPAVTLSKDDTKPHLAVSEAPPSPLPMPQPQSQSTLSPFLSSSFSSESESNYTNSTSAPFSPSLFPSVPTSQALEIRRLSAVKIKSPPPFPPPSGPLPIPGGIPSPLPSPNQFVDAAKLQEHRKSDVRESYSSDESSPGYEDDDTRMTSASILSIKNERVVMAEVVNMTMMRPEVRQPPKSQHNLAPAAAPSPSLAKPLAQHQPLTIRSPQSSPLLPRSSTPRTPSPFKDLPPTPRDSIASGSDMGGLLLPSPTPSNVAHRTPLPPSPFGSASRSAQLQPNSAFLSPGSPLLPYLQHANQADNRQSAHLKGGPERFDSAASSPRVTDTQMSSPTILDSWLADESPRPLPSADIRLRQQQHDVEDDYEPFPMSAYTDSPTDPTRDMDPTTRAALPRTPIIAVYDMSKSPTVEVNSLGYELATTGIPPVLKPIAPFIRANVDPRTLFADMVPVAEGQFGPVYSASYIYDDGSGSSNPRVAVKCIALSTPHHSLKISQLQTELEIMNSVRHANLLSMDDLYLDLKADGGSGALWIQMELMERSLADVLQLFEGDAEEVITERLIARFAKDCLSGIHHLQSLGIAHRDVRSDNMLLTAQGQLKLVDFANAVQVDDPRTVCSEVVGVLHWQAPEIRKGRYEPLKVDVWGLGATVWELIEGAPPFEDIADESLLPDRWEDLSQPQVYSRSLHDFLRLCSEPPETRPRAIDLLSTPYIKSAASPRDVMHLLDRCRELEE